MTEGFAVSEIITDSADQPIDCRFLEVNAAFERLTGLKRDNLIGRRKSECLPADDPEWIRLLGQVALTGEPLQIVKYSPALKRWYEVKANRSAPRQFAVLFTDVTERKQLEAAARLQFAEQATDKMWDAAYWIRRDGRFVYVNDAAARQLGYTRTELLALNITDIDPDLTPAGWTQGWDETKRTKHRIFEARHRAKDGRVFPVELTVTHLEADGDEYHFSVARDLTAQRQAEQALRDSEERLRWVIEATGTGFVTLDCQGRVTAANLEYLGLTGREQLEEVVGHNVEEWTAPHDRARNAQEVKNCLEHGVVQNLEIDYLTPTGQIIPIEINATVFSIDGTTQILTLCRNITARKQLATALRASEERLRRLLEHSPDAVSILDATTRTIWTTTAATRLLGYGPEELAARQVTELVHPDDFASFQALLIQTLAAPGMVVFGAVRLRHKNGSWRWIEGNATNLLTDLSIGGIVVNFRDITEHKQAEAALQASEQLYRALFENAADSIVLIDLQTLEFVAFNDEACRQLGYTREEFAKLKISDFDILDTDTVAVRQHIESLALDRVTEFETKQRTKTGAVLNVAVRSKLVQVGSKILTLGIGRDITERKQMIDALQQEQEKMALAVAGSNGAPWEIPMDPTQPGYLPDKMCASPRLKEFIGFRDDEFPDSVAAWFERIHPDDAAVVRASAQAHAAGQAPAHKVEYRIRHKDGSWRWLSSIGSLFRDQQGRPLRWAGIDWDITDRKRTEVELEQLVQERTQDLQAAQQRLQSIYDTSRDAIVFADITGRFLEFNHAFEKLTGYGGPELRQLTFFQLTPPEFVELSRRMTGNVVRTGETARYEKDYLRKDGTRVPVAITAWAVHDATGEITGIAGIVRDVTDQHRLQREILEVSDNERRRIGQDLHDDLCQMLTGITFAVGSLEERLTAGNLVAAAATHEIGELLQRANREAHNIAHGLYPTELEGVGLLAALQRLADEITRTGKAQCELLCDTSVAIPDQAQTLHIYRIVQEALANALRHGLATVITITLAVVDGQISLEVANNGRDWPIELAKPAGMGLNIMAYRARMIGGALQICRGEHGGTIVGLTLPARSDI